MKKNWSPRAILLAALLMLFGGIASAGESIPNLIKAGIDELCAGFAAVVSTLEGNFKSHSPHGCLGAFQFCPGTFERYFAGTVAEFLNDPKAQVVAWRKYEKDQWTLAVANGLVNLIGETVTFGGKSVVIDRSAILLACQFGCGKFGKLATFLKNRNCEARQVKDGNGVSVCKYLVNGASQNVSCFTGIPHDQVANVFPPAPSVPGSGVPSPLDGGLLGNAAPSCAAGTFGEAGPVEIVAGSYTVRFGSSMPDATLSRILDLLEKRKAGAR